MNDRAEKNVKLRTDYSAVLTNNLEERARIFQAVEKNRRGYLDFSEMMLQT